MKEKINKYIAILEKQSFINDLKLYFYEQELLHKKMTANTLNDIIECVEFMQYYIIKDKYDNISYSNSEKILTIKCKTSKIEIKKKEEDFYIIHVNNNSNGSYFDFAITNNVITVALLKEDYEKIIVNNIIYIIVNTFLNLLYDYYEKIYFIDDIEIEE